MCLLNMNCKDCTIYTRTYTCARVRALSRKEYFYFIFDPLYIYIYIYIYILNE